MGKFCSIFLKLNKILFLPEKEKIIFNVLNAANHIQDKC